MINVYVPTQDHEVEQLEFLEEWKTDTNTFEGDIVIAGDFNMYLSNMDKDNEYFKLSKASKCMINIIQQYAITDIWHQLKSTR